MAQKDKNRCKSCNLRPIDYVKEGLCRECYERDAARHPGKGKHRSYERPADMREDTYETKHGTGH